MRRRGSLRPGDVVAERFLVEALVGSGGSGQVYRATDRLGGMPIALKVLPTAAPRRFELEARVLGELHHPGIVRYVSQGQTPRGWPFLAMEWIEGETLAACLARGPLAVAGAARLGRRVAEALAAAHARGVIHGDVNPRNLMIPEGDPDRVKLLDFGVAWRRALAAAPGAGTPRYMAPEQARGSRHLDARVDVYALGCTLFECLTGRPVHTAPSLTAVLAQVLLDTPPAVEELRAEVPRELSGLIARMLAVDPSVRPRDGAEVAAELAPFAPSEQPFGGAPRRAPSASAPGGAGKRGLLGRLTPCVGRERELGALLGIFEGCVDEPGPAVALVTGPPGMGKSRLRVELVERIQARSRPVEVWIGRGDPLHEATPFGMLMPALRHAGVLVSEPPGELLGLDPWVDLIASRCRRQPLVLVLEDLQWADGAVAGLLAAAPMRLADLPFFVVALARPEVYDRFADLRAAPGLQTLQLGPLTDGASARLVQHALGERAGEAVRARLIERGAGVPLFLEELIHAELEGRGDAPPESVLALIRARFEAMEPEAREVLRAASLFGHVFWAGGVASVLGGGDAARAGDWLAILEERDVVIRKASSRFPGEAEYAFRHSLMRDVAWAMLTDEDRRLGRRLADGWLAGR